MHLAILFLQVLELLRQLANELFIFQFGSVIGLGWCELWGDLRALSSLDHTRRARVVTFHHKLRCKYNWCD